MNIGRVFLGFMLILLGVLFLLDQAGVAETGNLIADWWPIVIVGIGLAQLISAPRAFLGPVIVIGVGLALLAANVDAFDVNVWNIFWPVVIIAIGAWILLNRAGVPGQVTSENPEDAVNMFTIFGGNDIVSRSRNFQGGSMTVFFGGLTLDLREAQLAPTGAAIDVMAAFGGCDILVPRGWRVITNGLPIFGGFDDKTRNDPDITADAPHLTIRGTVMFGGIDIKHEK